MPEGEAEKFPPVMVTSLDIDINRHMNNGRYVKVAMNFLPDDFVISRFRVEYKKPAAKGDRLCPVVTRRDGEALYIALADESDQPYTVMEFIGKTHCKRV
jgi:acyl-ACP thioesterase